MTAYLKIGGLIAIALTCIGAWAYVSGLRTSLREAEDALTLSKARETSLTAQLTEATKLKSTLTKQLSAAEAERNTIRAQLQKSLSKLRLQQPPQECKAAIDWAVENKGDLAW
jgi:septal ring factor EnvC (AmiA/AmiB activator)